MEATSALGKIGTVRPEETLPIVKELAGDEDPEVREAAAFALGETGKKNLQTSKIKGKKL